jgi:hypothetical protein
MFFRTEGRTHPRELQSAAIQYRRFYLVKGSKTVWKKRYLRRKARAVYTLSWSVLVLLFSPYIKNGEIFLKSNIRILYLATVVVLAK